VPAPTAVATASGLPEPALIATTRLFELTQVTDRPVRLAPFEENRFACSESVSPCFIGYGELKNGRIETAATGT